MDDAQIQRIINNPQFQAMANKKTSIGTIFSIITLIVYFGYLLFIGFNKSWFVTPVATGATTTIGVYIGFAIIIFAVAITGIYVHKANGEFDSMANKVVDEIKEGKI